MEQATKETGDSASKSVGAGKQSSSERLPLGEKVAWGSGGFAEQLAVNGLNNLFVPIYNIGFGLSSVMIGWAVSIPRLFDMLSDPVVGNMSDNCRSRFGRRRPFIFAGAFLMAFAFGISYMASPHWGDVALFSYAVSTCIFFYLMYTIFSIPFSALGLELVKDYDERADVQKFRMIFASCASFLIPWLYKICIFMGEHVREVFESGGDAWYAFLMRPLAAMAVDDGIAVEVVGIRYVAWGLAIAIVISALPASLFTKEKLQVESLPKINLLSSGRLVLKNRSFRTLVMMIFFVISGLFFMSVLVTYANIFYLFGGDKSTGATWNGFYGTTNGIASLLSTLLVPIFVRRFDKKKVLLTGLTIAATAIASSWFLLNPNYPILQLVLAMAIGFGMASCWLLTGAFIADICDEDEYLNGYRREGMFAAFYGFVVKLAFTGIAFTFGYALQFIGYEAGADRMTPETIFRLRLFIAGFPSTCLVLAALIFMRYSLTRARVHEIQEQLQIREESQANEAL